MYMTEEEARERWCPFVRARDFWAGSACSGNADAFDEKTNDNADYNRNPLDSRCIASRCMAWRWKQPGKFEAVQKYREEHGCSVREAKEYVDREHPELTMEPTHGYCGLAGRP